MSVSRLSSALPESLKPSLRSTRERFDRLRQYARFVRQGTAPLFLAKLTLRRLAKNPATLSEKVLYKMAHDRQPIMRTFADKIAVRDYVADRVGRDILPRRFVVTDDAEKIDWNSLPDEYVCKVSHASGGVIIVTQSAPEDARLPDRAVNADWLRYRVRPEHADPAAQVERINRWLRQDYYWYPGRLPEWCYRGVPRRVIVEEFLADENGGIPNDYKFFVFDGKCLFMHVDLDRADNHTRAIFNRDWEPINALVDYPRAQIPPEKPARFDRMVEIAEELGRGINFVRVDLYSIGDRIVFGELTNYPEAGQSRISPRSVAELWGDALVLPTARRAFALRKRARA
jgi:hypothetical protein